MEIVEGIHRVDEASSGLARSNVYLVVDGTQLTVVDAGIGGNAKKIVQYVERLGFKPEEVAFIVLTHYHADHMGSAKDLKDLLPKAKVVVHEAESPYVSGKEKYPKPKNILMRAVSSFVKPTPVPVDLAVKEGDKVGNLVVIHTPGHTLGSICLLDEQHKALFSGDALRTDNGKVVEPPQNFNVNTVQARKSIGKIAALSFGVLLPGHGTPITNGAAEETKKLGTQLT